MGREGDGFFFPIGETEEGTNSDAAEAPEIGAFWAVEAPVVIFLWSSGVELLLFFELVGFLVNDQSFRAVIDEVAVLVVFHRADLNADRGNHFP